MTITLTSLTITRIQCNHHPHLSTITNAINLTYIYFFSYKLVCPATWPSYRGNIKDATAAILDHTRLAYDTEFGKTKIFIRSPQTLTLLERKRLEAIPRIVIILQKVMNEFTRFIINHFVLYK